MRNWDPDWQLVQPLDPARSAASTSSVDLDEFQARIDAVIKENLHKPSEHAQPGSTGGRRGARSAGRKSAATARDASAAKPARRLPD